MPKGRKRYHAKKGEKRLATRGFVHRAIRAKPKSKFMVEESQQALEITSTASFTCITDAISRAITSQSGRFTDRLKWEKIRCDFHAYPKATTYDVNTFRVWVVQWKEDTALSAFNAISKFIYDSTTAPILQSGYIESDAEFKVLYDSGMKFVAPYVQQSASSVRLAGGGHPWLKRHTIAGKKCLQTTYNAGANTGQNQIFVVCLGSTATGDNAMSINFKIRLYFQSV